MNTNVTVCNEGSSFQVKSNLDLYGDRKTSTSWTKCSQSLSRTFKITDSIIESKVRKKRNKLKSYGYGNKYCEQNIYS